MKTVMVCLEKCVEADKLAKELVGRGLKVRLIYIENQNAVKSVA